MKLSLGFSPCPNDTFIFDALVNNKIDTGGLSFDIILEDVETLNKWALQDKLDITKLSYGVLPLVLDKYLVLNSGSALGRGVGPLLISNTNRKILNVEENLIAIPGQNTTAHLLFSTAYPDAKKKVFLRYDEIENFVLEDKGLGVIIHENRFTYAARGLHKIVDLGDYWEKKTGKPIPLGGIVVKRSINEEISIQVDKLIQQSIEYACKHNSSSLTEFVKINAQEMNEEIMKMHIGLYVNDFSISLKDEGRAAVVQLLNIHERINKTNSFGSKPIFLGN